ncbi:MAG: bifunctional oligoribonuclease/PAP phosphatase NrnA [Nonlabens sp.]|nr:bifunctional oligoribonuclease/PAP phosphatase NrnA [Nonlabens sp.]
MNSKQIASLKALLDTPQKIVIVPHKGPDGDAIGSTTGLYGYLKNAGHDATIIAPNDFPQFLKWMDFTEDILIYDKNVDAANNIIKDAQLIFILDHNSFKRAGEMESVLAASDATFVMIDHHEQPDDFATYTYSDTGMSSTCQMVYHFLEMLEQKDHITPQIATALYTGIVTDTGNFKYRSCTSTTLRVAASLVDAGANGEQINRNLFDANNLSRLKLLAVALSNLVVLPQYRTAYITISQQELDDNGFQKGDTEGFVNYALSLENVVFAQIFIENKDEGILKTSLRSKGTFDVNLMAREHWNGGGHKNAAGGRSDDNIVDTIKKLISILPLYENDLNATAI